MAEFQSRDVLIAVGIAAVIYLVLHLRTCFMSGDSFANLATAFSPLAPLPDYVEPQTLVPAYTAKRPAAVLRDMPMASKPADYRLVLPDGSANAFLLSGVQPIDRPIVADKM